MQEIELDKLIRAYQHSFERLYPPFLFPKFLQHPPDDQHGTWVSVDENNNITGFASVVVKSEKCTEAVLRTLFVVPEYRGKGIGCELVKRAESFAKEQKAEKIILGPCIDDYFTLGVPVNSPAYKFFIHRGFSEDEGFGYYPIWMSVALQNWQPPERFEPICEKLRAENIQLRISTQADQPAILELTREHFPGWHNMQFKPNSEKKHPAPSSIAIRDNQTAGFTGPLWVRQEQFGELGSVGVSPDFRRKGIGVAVVTQACQWWKDNGAKQGDLWTGTTNPAVKLYKEVGFGITETYSVVSKTF